MNTLTLLSDAKYFDEGSAKFAEVRTLLDSKHAKEKLEAMKRLMAMITIGRDVSSFFPDVVKNIVVESQEVKKLVYMYLIHYAEQNQELALLTINSFQKDLASHSQRVRANAMKAMSSIRLPVAIPLVILALKAAVKDPSSYVRRAAASAIPKVWDVDTEQQELLIELIQELLTNNEPLVLGSAIFAYIHVCPDRFDLIHPHFRKICHLLADFDEWGQIIACDLLLRYGRQQFTDPVTASSKVKAEKASEKGVNRSDMLSPVAPSPTGTAGQDLSIFNTPAESDKKGKKSKQQKGKKKKSDQFYSDEDDSDESTKSSSGSSDDDSDDGGKNKKPAASKKVNPNPPALPASSSNVTGDSFASSALSDFELDEDHRLLIKQALQLLQSSNTGVILAVTSLMWSLAPSHDLEKVIKPLVRLSRNKRNIQYIVLINIATMASSLPILFRPYIKDFFIFQHEPRYIKDIKLDILTAITSETSIGIVMKEFTVYTQDADKAFVTKCIDAIARCGIMLPSIVERCLRGLLTVVQKNTNQNVTTQAIIAIRQLLQVHSQNITPYLLQTLAKLLDTLNLQTQSEARISIIWMCGEYREQIPKLAPDVLRKLCKTFMQEEDTVRIQILNLALKLFLSNQKQTALVFKYIMDLCKYDKNIDLRDRARMMRALFFKKKASSESAGSQPAVVLTTEVKDYFKSILLTSKPVPKLSLPFEGREKWILGSLSHALNQQVGGYRELQEFPLVQPDPTVRRPKSLYENDTKDTKSKSKHRKRRGSGSDSGSDGSRSGSDSDRSSRSRSRSSRSSRSSHGSSRSGSSRSRSRSGSRAESEFSSFGSEDEGSSSSRSRSRSRSGSDSDDGGKKKKASSRRRRSRSRSPSRSRSRTPSPTPSSSSSSAAAGGASWSLDFLDLKGLDLSEKSIADPNLHSGSGLGLETHTNFTHSNDLMSPFGGSSSGTPHAASTPSSSSSSSTASKAAEAENAILARAFGGGKK